MLFYLPTAYYRTYSTLMLPYPTVPSQPHTGARRRSWGSSGRTDARCRSPRYRLRMGEITRDRYYALQDAVWCSFNWHWVKTVWISIRLFALERLRSLGSAFIRATSATPIILVPFLTTFTRKKIGDDAPTLPQTGKAYVRLPVEISSPLTKETIFSARLKGNNRICEFKFS